MGIIVPNMGKEVIKARSLIDALFSSTQKKVLGLLFGRPERSFFASEIIGIVASGSGAVQRELNKLVESGLVTVSRVGNQKHFQANSNSPIFEELCGLIRKTVGLTEPLREALESSRSEIDLALVFGSVAKGGDTAASDIDLLLVSDSLSLERVFQILAPAEQSLDRKISPTLYTPREFERRVHDANPFLENVLRGEVIVLIGSVPDEAK